MADIDLHTLHAGFLVKVEKWPTDYALVQRQVNVAMKHGDKICIGNMCDEDFSCIRHRRTADLVFRYLRRKKPNECK